MLLFRYLLREVLRAFGVIVLVLFGIALCHKAIRLVVGLSAGHMLPSLVWQMLFLQAPELLAFLLPIGLFFAVLLSYSRLFASQEIPVMLACGRTWGQLLIVPLLLAGGVAWVTGTLTCYGIPWLAHQREQLMQTIGPRHLLQMISSGRFHSPAPHTFIFYVEAVDRDRSGMHRVFIAEHPKEESAPRITVARFAKVQIEGGHAYLELQEGQRYQGNPGERDYQITRFHTYRRFLETPGFSKESVGSHRTAPFSELYGQKTPGSRAEWQWRLAVPLSAPLLGFLAVPLSVVSVRQGSFARVFAGILLCLAYWNVLTLGKRWIAIGQGSWLLWGGMGVFWLGASFAFAYYSRLLQGTWKRFSR